MGLAHYLFEFLTELSLCMVFVFVGKALFDESIIVDRIAVVILLVEAFGSEFTNWLVEEQAISQALFLNIVFSAPLFIIFIRGGKKGLWKRLRAAIDAMLICMFPLSVYAFTMMELVRPQLAVESNHFEDVELDCFYVIALSVIICIVLYRELIKKGICLQCSFKERLFLTFIGSVVFISCESLIIIVGDNYEKGVMIPVPIRGALIGFITFFYIAVPFFMVRNKLAVYYETGQKHQQEINELELRHFEQYKEAQEETRRFRHDTLNNLMAIQMLQNEGKSEEAKQYVDELLGRIQTLSPKVVTGCDMLDCIITSKLERMEQSKISFATDGVMDYGLDMSSVDICTVFANALDNAIEACEKVADNRSIVMKIKRTNAFYCVTIENSMVEDTVAKHMAFTEHSRFTTKKNRELHGYGLSNIQKAVKRYNGETSVEIKDNIFVLTILLPVQKEHEA